MICSASLTTCSFVSTMPSSASMTKPDPKPAVGCRPGEKNCSKRLRGRTRRVRTVLMVTTAGATRRAAATMAFRRESVTWEEVADEAGGAASWANVVVGAASAA